MMRGIAIAAVGSMLVANLPNAFSADATADGLKQRIVAHARTVGADDYAFTRTARVEQVGGGKAQPKVLVERFDPAKPADQRWKIESVDGRPPTAQELKAHSVEASKRHAPSYAKVAEYFSAPATTTVDSHGRTVFHFAALTKGTVIVAGSDISENSSADAVVDTTGATPFVEQVHFKLNKAIRMKLVAKIESFEGTTRFRMLPDGKPVPAEQMSDVNGSMLGKEGRIRTTLTYTDVRPVGSKS